MAKVISGTNSIDLAKKVSDELGLTLINKIVRKFPDNEMYIRLEKTNFHGEDVIVVHSLYPDQNESLTELLLTTDAVVENGGVPILVIPYLAYSRQDKIFQEGEAFSLKTISKLLKALGVKQLITVDPHFHRKPGKFDFFGLPATNVSAVTLQIEHVKNLVDGKFMIVGPDKGSKDFLSVADNTVFLDKEKYCPACNEPATSCSCENAVKEYVVKTSVPSNLHDLNVLLLDDIISSGSTIIEAARALNEKNNKVYVGCTHGQFLKDSKIELRKNTEYFFSTDSIQSELSKVSIFKIICSEIEKITK